MEIKSMYFEKSHKLNSDKKEVMILKKKKMNVSSYFLCYRFLQKEKKMFIISWKSALLRVKFSVRNRVFQ